MTGAAIPRGADAVLPAEKVEIETELFDFFEPVELDPDKINQVLLNLYINSWQAMPEGGNLELATSVTTVSEADGAPLFPEVLFAVGM